METHLILHNIGAVLSSVLLLCLIIFAIAKNSRKASNITLALTLLATLVFYLSHLFGVNVSDPNLSRNILMLNISIIWIGVFLNHCVLLVLNKAESRKVIIYAVYFVGLVLSLVYIIFPDTFLLPSVPKLYFPNYYVPGSLHILMRVIFNFIVPIYFVGEIIHSYVNGNPIIRNRLKYFLISIILGYGNGFFLVLLVYDISIDPAWGVLFAFFFAIPFVYSVLMYELLDIKIVAKRAFAYSLLVVAFSVLFSLINTSNSWLLKVLPSFPEWLIPTVTSFVGVGIAFLIWLRLKEVEVMKYEFINIIMHKFRTPLTHIKWASEDLEKSGLNQTQNIDLGEITTANAKLVGLINVLVNATSSDTSGFMYKFKKYKFQDLLDEVIRANQTKARSRSITLINKVPTTPFVIEADAERLKFVFQTLIENSIKYTQIGGELRISASIQNHQLAVVFADNGAGIKSSDLPMIFSKFFRAENSKRLDTEGMGIGLYVSRDIVIRHGGSMKVESAGENQGSTFTVYLPLA